MKRGDIKANRLIVGKPTNNKIFKELGEEVLRNTEVRGLSEWTIKSYQHHNKTLASFYLTTWKILDIIVAEY